MQILLDLIHSRKNLPLVFISHLLDFTLNTNNENMIEQVLSIISVNADYQSILKTKTNKVLEEMKTNDDSKNIRLLEKYLSLFHHSRSLISSNDLSSIIDRLINSSSHSSISFSVIDTRYILAMIILNSLSSFDKYLSFLQQTWKSIVREMNGTNHLKPVVIAYAKQWEHVMNTHSTIDDIDALVKCLNDQYELISKFIQSIDQNQFQQWIEKTIQHIVCQLYLFFINPILFLLYRKFH
jgi:hypothetical protein